MWILTVLGFVKNLFSIFDVNFIKNNFKYVVYGIIAIIVAVILWQGYNIVNENIHNQVVIQQYKDAIAILEQSNRDKDRMIELQKSLADLNNKIISERDNTINSLIEQYNNIVNSSLGKDLDNPAAESLKELIKRLQEEIKK